MLPHQAGRSYRPRKLTMKRHLPFTLLIPALVLSACAYDSFEPPESTLEGVVMYEGEPVGVRQNGVDFELWEPGYQLDGFIAVNVHQDGTFTSRLFDGRYKLVRKEGPWVTNTDTINVDLNGSQTIEVPVTPFFVLQNENITLNGSTVSATFDVEQIVSDAELQSVALFINSRQFVDATGPGNVAAAFLDAADVTDLSGIELSLDVPSDQHNQEAIFARIGVQTVGTPELLYSQVQKIEM